MGTQADPTGEPSDADAARAALIVRTWATGPEMVRLSIDQLERLANERGTDERLANDSGTDERLTGSGNGDQDHGEQPTVGDDLGRALRARGLADDDVAHLLGVVDATVSIRATTREAGAFPSSAGEPSEVESQEAGGVKARGVALLDAIETLIAATARWEGAVVAATTQLTGVFGRLLLADKGLTSPEELSARQRDKWRARAKSLARTEIGTSCGWGPGEVSDLVALATAPASVREPIRAALESGEAPWRLVRRYYRATSGLGHEDAGAIATGLFGPDPTTAVTERLDGAGDFTGRPWFHREFYRALEREVAKCAAKDPNHASRTREAVLGEADVWVTLEESGVASVGMRCGAVQAVAIADRIETAARLARKHGDQRSLGVLRATIATALLMNGTLIEPEPTDASESRVHRLEQVLSGMPQAVINVLIPADTLLPHLPDMTVVAAPQQEAFDESLDLEQADEPHQRQPQQGEPRRIELGESSVQHLGGGGIAEIVGKHRHFLSGEQARELALQPGSSLFRIVTDPVTGRYVERSTTSYRFDAAMRSHIQFADMSCRAPGCTIPARWCQLDHVEEFGTPDGHTSEANGALLHTGHHQHKTEKLWDAIIDGDRDITWTSALGKIYQTKAHDYTQYSALMSGVTAEVTAGMDRPTDLSTGSGVAIDTDINESAETLVAEARADQAIYAALSYRETGERLHEPDDLDRALWVSPGERDPEEFPGWDLITLVHTDASGIRSYRPSPEVVAQERTRMRRAGADGGSLSEGECQGTSAAGHGTASAHTSRSTKAPASPRRIKPPSTPWSRQQDDPPPF